MMQEVNNFHTEKSEESFFSTRFIVSVDVPWMVMSIKFDVNKENKSLKKFYKGIKGYGIFRIPLIWSVALCSYLNLHLKAVSTIGPS